ncbi:GTPase activating protein (GAP) for Rho1p [Mycoemilia scoparia]|uniref:GTPase activating protein (GAP) for Rho1p n=1 Tax=Mycoemilia scoparia TaxID=417184 RepID=A0A9W7ZUT6_9FUNG|nr:GTPase activating protein (GAP) for Rho1p [Mycoemilia scoparia]
MPATQRRAPGDYSNHSGSETSLPFALAHANDPGPDAKLEELAALEAKVEMESFQEAVGRTYGEHNVPRPNQSKPARLNRNNVHSMFSPDSSQLLNRHTQIQRESISGPIPPGALASVGLPKSSVSIPKNRFENNSPTHDKKSNVFVRLCGRNSSEGMRPRPKSEAIGSRTLLLDDLFGSPLEAAVLASGTKVGYFMGTGEPCIVPAITAICGKRLVNEGQQTTGIFRVAGSVTRSQKLQQEFDRTRDFGKNLDWTGYTMHDTATVFRRYLTNLPGPLISVEFYDRFRKVLRSGDDLERIEKYASLIYKLPVFQRHTLLYTLHILHIFSQEENTALTRMDASNLAAVFQPSLLVHPDHFMKPDEYKHSKPVVEFLITNVDKIMPPESIPKSMTLRAFLTCDPVLRKEIGLDEECKIITEQPIVFQAQCISDASGENPTSSISTFNSRRVPARLYDPSGANSGSTAALTTSAAAAIVSDRNSAAGSSRAYDTQPVDLLAAINYNYRTSINPGEAPYSSLPRRGETSSLYSLPPQSRSPGPQHPSLSSTALVGGGAPRRAESPQSGSLPGRFGGYNVINGSSEPTNSRFSPNFNQKDRRPSVLSSPPTRSEAVDGVLPQHPLKPINTSVSDQVDMNNAAARSNAVENALPRLSALLLSPDASKWLEQLPSTQPLPQSIAATTATITDASGNTNSRFGEIESLPPPPPERRFQPAVFNYASKASKMSALSRRLSKERKSGPAQIMKINTGKPQTPGSDDVDPSISATPSTGRPESPPTSRMTSPTSLKNTSKTSHTWGVSSGSLRNSSPVSKRGFFPFNRKSIHQDNNNNSIHSSTVAVYGSNHGSESNPTSSTDSKMTSDKNNNDNGRYDAPQLPPIPYHKLDSASRSSSPRETAAQNLNNYPGELYNQGYYGQQQQHHYQQQQQQDHQQQPPLTASSTQTSPPPTTSQNTATTTSNSNRPQSFRLLNFSRSDFDSNSIDSTSPRQFNRVSSPTAKTFSLGHTVEKQPKRESVGPITRLRRHWSKSRRNSRAKETLVSE